MLGLDEASWLPCFAVVSGWIEGEGSTVEEYPTGEGLSRSTAVWTGVVSAWVLPNGLVYLMDWIVDWITGLDWITGWPLPDYLVTIKLKLCVYHMVNQLYWIGSHVLSLQ